tara:strand:- start:683 stop:1159 length:477 start_codon:yes stop_codon:yes gene_type:complete
MNRATERLGRSGEYFAASVLSMQSDSVLFMPPASEVDLLFNYQETFLKVQVKTKSHRHKTERDLWKFDIRRGSHTKIRFFEESQIDLFALCCTEYDKVLFYPFHEVTNDKGTSKTAIYVKDEIIRNTNSHANLEAALKSITEHHNQLQYDYGRHNKFN